VHERNRFQLQDLTEGWHMGTFQLNRIVFFTVVLLAGELFAQTTEGGIVGTIRDKKEHRLLVRK